MPRSKHLQTYFRVCTYIIGIRSFVQISIEKDFQMDGFFIHIWSFHQDMDSTLIFMLEIVGWKTLLIIITIIWNSTFQQHGLLTNVWCLFVKEWWSQTADLRLTGQSVPPSFQLLESINIVIKKCWQGAPTCLHRIASFVSIIAQWRALLCWGKPWQKSQEIVFITLDQGLSKPNCNFPMMNFL